MKKKLKRERDCCGIQIRSLEHERPRVDHWANEPVGSERLKIVLRNNLKLYIYQLSF